MSTKRKRDESATVAVKYPPGCDKQRWDQIHADVLVHMIPELTELVCHYAVLSIEWTHVSTIGYWQFFESSKPVVGGFQISGTVDKHTTVQLTLGVYTTLDPWYNTTSTGVVGSSGNKFETANTSETYRRSRAESELPYTMSMYVVNGHACVAINGRRARPVVYDPEHRIMMGIYRTPMVDIPPFTITDADRLPDEFIPPPLRPGDECEHKLSHRRCRVESIDENAARTITVRFDDTDEQHCRHWHEYAPVSYFV